MNRKQLPQYLLIGCIIPIILFATIAVAVPYFIKNMDMPTQYDKNTAWGRIFFTNDKISFVPIDSIDYFGNQFKDNFKNQGQKYAAEITPLFKDYKARKITVISDLLDNYTVHIWYNNGCVHFLDGLSYKRGQWIGNIASNDSIHNPQKINLGRVEGSSYSTRGLLIDISGTYLNGFLILTICVLIVCYFIHVSKHIKGELSWIILGLLGASIGFLACNLYNGILVSEAYMIEIILALFCICEFGIICTLYSFSATSKANAKDNDNKIDS